MRTAWGSLCCSKGLNTRGGSHRAGVDIEKILPADLESVYPLCLAGKRNGPLEDCGGLWGYEEMLEILADPKHPDHEDRKAWLKEVYSVRTWTGDAFDQEEINKRLKKLRPRSRRSACGPT